MRLVCLINIIILLFFLGNVLLHTWNLWSALSSIYLQAFDTVRESCNHLWLVLFVLPFFSRLLVCRSQIALSIYLYTKMHRLRIFQMQMLAFPKEKQLWWVHSTQLVPKLFISLGWVEYLKPSPTKRSPPGKTRVILLQTNIWFTAVSKKLIS